MWVLYKIHILRIQLLVQEEPVELDEMEPLLELVSQVLHEVLVVRRVSSISEVLRVIILISSMIVIILLGAL